MTFGTVAILGPGLIGGSLALALAERGLADKLVIYGRKDTSFPAIKAKLPQVELTTDVVTAVRDADIVVLCVPIEKMADLVKQFVGSLKPTALVTDVGSVKGSVENEIAPLLAGKALWIGSHPMAGSEQAGFSVARADLFVGAAVVVTPTKDTQKEAEERAARFWESVGARVVKLNPVAHDDFVAQISHLPHILAVELVNNASSAARELAGGGFRDTTRIASGSPELWTGILLANAQAVNAHLHGVIVDLFQLTKILENPDKAAASSALLAVLKAAQDARSQLPEKNSKLS